MHIGSLLTWQRPEELSRALELARSRHLSRMVEQVSGILTQLSADGEAVHSIAQIRERLGNLPESASVRILMAPETHYQLTKPLAGGKGLIEFLDRAIVAEECRMGRAVPPASGVWTVNGDMYLAPPVDDAAGNANVQHGTHEEHYLAPEAHGLVIDLRSPYAYLEVDESGAEPPLAMLSDSNSEALALRALDRVRQATERIQRSCSPAYELLVRSLRVVVLLRHSKRADVYRSISSRASIGKTVIVNAHLEDVTTAKVADTLIHEAIHSFLYEREQRRRWIRNGINLERNIPSPWTGNLLRIDSYIHACFVWFALAMFWALPGSARLFPASEFQPLLERARRGFLNADILAPIRHHSDSIDSAIPEEIAWLANNLSQSGNVT
jgi:hypothetical protein